MTKKKLLPKSLTSLLIIAICAIFSQNAMAATGYGGVAITFGNSGAGGGLNYTPQVTTIAAPGVNLPLTVGGGSQSGSLSQSFTDNSRVDLNVPGGAVDTKTVFSVTSDQLSDTNMPANNFGAFLLGGRVYNINATDASGNDVSSFNKDLKITISIPNLQSDSDLGVYWFNRSTNQWTLVPGAVFDSVNGKVSFGINHLTEFAIFKVPGRPAIISASATSEEVQGAKVYSNSTLLRGSDNVVYVLVGQKKKKINDLNELKRYIGQKIYNVSDDIIKSYPDYIEPSIIGMPNPASVYCNNKGGKIEVRKDDNGEYGVCIFDNGQECEEWAFFRGDCKKEVLGEEATTKKEFADNGSLIRAKDGRIYIIEKGAKIYIPSILELGAYRGRTITDVSDQVINSYPDAKIMSEGNLIRFMDMKVYVIKNGIKEHVTNLIELAKYAGKKIFNVVEGLIK